MLTIAATLRTGDSELKSELAESQRTSAGGRASQRVRESGEFAEEYPVSSNVMSSPMPVPCSSSPTCARVPMRVRPAMATSLEPQVWGAGFLRVEERELPPQLHADLRLNAPQAFLRDLFRPVREFFAVLEPVEGTRLLGAWQEATQEARAARTRAEIPRIEPTPDEVAARQAWRRRFLAEPWTPFRPDDAPRGSEE